MTLETWPTAKKSTFELRQIDFIFREHSIDLDELIKVYVIRFLVEKFLHEIYQFESLKGLTTSVVRYTLKPKISQYRNGIWCASYTLKVLSLLKKLDFINCSFLRDDVRNLAYGKKVNFWTKTDRFYFPRALDRSWWADQSICHPFFW